MSGRVLALLPLLAVLVSPPCTAALDLGAMDLETLDDCDDLLRRYPRDPDAYGCFYQVGATLGDLEGAIRRLEALLAIDPDRHWAGFYAAMAYARMGRNNEELLDRTIAGFAAAGDAVGEIRARRALAYTVRTQARYPEARELLEGALAVARESGEVQQGVGVLADLGWLARTEGDYRLARQRFKEAEVSAFPDGAVWNQFTVLDGLAAVSFDTGRYGEAWEYYGRAKALPNVDPFRMAGILQNMGLVAQALATQGEMSQEAARRLNDESLALATRSGDRPRELRGRIQRVGWLDGEEAAEEARRAVALAREMAHKDLAWALWRLAEATLGLDPESPERYREARGYASEAIEFSRRRGDRMRAARGLTIRGVLAEKAGEREAAVADYLEALDTIEAIRDLTPDREVRPRVFASFAAVYRNFAAMLLDPEDRPSTAEERAMAFAVMERLRARELLDRLDAGRGAEREAPELDAARERIAVLEEIATVQRQLLEADVAESDRETLLARLERLEVEEGRLRDAIARSDPEFAAVRRPRLATLTETAAALGPDEAMIVFLANRTSARGSPRERAQGITYHAMALHREGVDVARLPPPSEVRHDTELLLALLERRDGSERPAARRLGEKLLGETLALLPPGVERLILVPDGDLHRLPFGALIAPADEVPLAARHTIGLVPSATAWLRWRREDADLPERNLLALADPALPTTLPQRADLRDAGFLDEVPRLGRLPHAREEAQAMLLRIGGDGELLVGEAATEAALKGTAPATFRVLHLAAHALVDERYPERSAIVLSPGGPSEDGLLQFREILDLDLDDQLVVLSACRSGGGPVVGGDGVLGVATAFFRAGARTVVAGLMPLRDDEASALVEELAGNLGRGLDVGAALAAARRTLIRRGAPAAAWAGLVVLGDPDLVVVPVKKEERGLAGRAVMAALALVAAFTLIAVVVGRRRPIRS